MVPPTRDLGTIDMRDVIASQWVDINEYVPDLMWPTSVQMYGRMRRDPRLAAILKAYSLPIRRATWAVDPAGCRDEVVQVVADDLGLPILGADANPGPARRRGVNWSEHLRLALLSLTFGHMPFERRYEIRGGQARLVNLGERMPWTIGEIDLNRDGTLKAVRQEYGVSAAIPANRLVWYAHDREGATWTGRSLLREAYGPWILKHEMWRVHSTSIRRFGMGVPSVEAPPGASPGQIAEAQRLASAMRAGDTAGAGLPNGFTFKLTGLSGSVPDAVEMIRYLDQQMSSAALTGFLDLGQTQTGSRALSESFVDLFMLSLQAVADEVASVATSGQPGLTGAVTDLVDVNWGEDEPAPRVVCTDVGRRHDLTVEALHELVSADVIHPDDDLESYLRATYRLPPRKRDDVATAERSYAYDLDYGILTIDERRAQINLPPLPNGAGQALPTPSNLRYVPPDPETGPEAPQVNARAARGEPVPTVDDRRAHLGLPALPRGAGARLPDPDPGPGSPAAPAPVHPTEPAGDGAAPTATARPATRRRGTTQPAPHPRGRKARQASIRAAGDPAAGHRQLTMVEAASGVDPDQIQNEHEEALAALLAAWATVSAAQIAVLVEQVAAAVAAGEVAALAALQVETVAAAEVIAPALIAMAAAGTAQVIAEAASAGVKLTAPAPAEGPLEDMAATIAALMGSATAAAAGREAVRVWSPGASADEIAELVRVHMEGLTDAWPREQLGGALWAAQAHGRWAAFEAAPDVTLVASEILDINTCEPCLEIDGTEFETRAEAGAAYAAGGYISCLGGLRCRGILIGRWGDS
ncbi:phage portal protein family protein [Actinomadura luteofluorescens]|uniref:phage portal protein family protein n=1 Tax=Actinomadura luteofluorescens TaxID=46163 RepID=UPI003D94C186